MFHNHETLHELQISIGEKIRARRKQLALSMDELTELSGIDSSTISRAETGVSQITLDTAVQLSRALRLPLTELAAAAALDEQSYVDRLGAPASQAFTNQDVTALLEIYRAQREVAEGLLVTWLNRLAEQVAASKSNQVPVDFRDTNIQLLLIRHDLFQFKIKLPDNCALTAVPAIFQFGGSIGHGEIQLLLTAISDDRNLFQKLDRQSKDVLRRLQSSTPDRVRISDLVKLENELNIDLLGMLARAERVSKDDFEPDFQTREKRANEARLISLFVIITFWFRELCPHDVDWMSTIREEIILASQQPRL